jgi:nitric oxide reductase NorD protein
MLDWEENVFVGLKAVYQRLVVRPREKSRVQVVARLRDRRRSLLLLAQMIAGRPLAVFESSVPVLCRSERVFLPREFSAGPSRDSNEALYEIKALLAGLAIRDGWQRNGTPLKEMISRYRAEFPALDEKLARISSQLGEGKDLWSLLGAMPEATLVSDSARHLTAAIEDKPPSANQVTTEIEGKGSAEVTVLQQNEDGEGADMPMHTFEKVESVEEYTGLSRKSDGEDELAEHAEGLAELTMTQVLRSMERPRSIYRSDVILDGLAMEVDDARTVEGIPYPEWNYRQNCYRPDWCRVREQAAVDASQDWSAMVECKHRRLIRQLRCQFASLRSEWLRQRRQPVGDEFDVDAVVDSEVERRTGHSPSEAIYVDRRCEMHDVAALILLDESYSTDAWIEDRRVLDIIRESVFCVGEVLESDIESFAVAAFSSNTRRSCQFKVVKAFREPWLHARNRLSSLEPRGYTRIGPALRHAQELLSAERAARKTVILLTDGRPCDYDRYEGTYGIKDVKKAIEVGRRNGIHTHAFAVEKQAAEFFPQMFTKHDYDILPHPDGLARTMCRLFGRLLSR